MHTVNARMPSFQTPREKEKTPKTSQRNGEMEFNSKLKIHVIYHYLEGDWEKAISRHLLAGAVRQQEPEPGGYCPTFLLLQQLQRRWQPMEGPCCFLPPETLSHHLETSTGGREVPGHRRCHLHF